MKIKVLQDTFSNALQTSLRFTNTRAQLPVLGNILISANKNSVSISATNLENSININFGGQVKEGGGITVPSKSIADIVSNLNKETIDIESKEENLIISTESFKSVLTGMNPSDFPAIPTSVGKNFLEIPSATVAGSLENCLFAVSTDETRPTLTGVLMILDKDRLTLVATDGFRLSKKTISVKNTTFIKKVILPKNTLAEIVRLADDNPLKFSVSTEENQAIFAIGDAVLSSRIIDGEFPDFEKIIPKSAKIKVNLDKEDFSRSVKLASVFARDSANVVKLVVSKDKLKVMAESQKSGSGENTIEADVTNENASGEILTIAFNYRFIEDFLGIVKGESVELQFNDANSPGVFLDPKDPDLLHLIMPVRLNT